MVKIKSIGAVMQNPSNGSRAYIRLQVIIKFDNGMVVRQNLSRPRQLTVDFLNGVNRLKYLQFEKMRKTKKINTADEDQDVIESKPQAYFVKAAAEISPQI